MTGDEILKHTAGANYPRVKATLAAILHKYPQKFRMVQIGNTLFLTTIKDPQTVEVHVDTADNAQGFVHASMAYARQLKQQGVKTAIATIQNPTIIRMYQHMGVPFQLHGNQAIINIGAMQ